MFGLYGTTVTPHVIMTFENYPKAVGGSFLIKAILLFSYLVWQLYCKKSYLKLAPIEGTSRLQLQHPVNHCNPLSSHGCKTNFRGFDELDYCKQHKGVVSSSLHQETCEYFDEFDIKMRGYTSHNMLIPTRETSFNQTVLCGGREAPCDKKYEFVDEETIYVADIESFTLMIDHSMVCPDLFMNLKSWDMVGFYEYCENTLGNLDNGCSLKPIHRASSDVSAVEKKEEHKSFKMWMERNPLYTFFPFLPSGVDVDKVNSPFIKIPSGDIIKVADLLRELGVDLDEHRNKSHSRRHSGVVVVIDIEYSNFKAFSWPNHLPPVYKYKIKLSPADEYKVMQTNYAGKSSHRRVIVDTHGIYVIINTQGFLGVWCFMYIGLMLLGALALEGFARYIVTMGALNCFGGEKRNKVGDHVSKAGDEESLEEIIAREVDVPTLSTRNYSRIPP